MKFAFKFLVPPILPLMPVIILGVIVVFMDFISPPHFINGQSDDAPMRSAAVFFGLCPFVYLVLLAVHSICILIQKKLKYSIVVAYLIAILLTAITISFLSIHLTHGSDIRGSFSYGIFISLILLVPMGLAAWALKYFTNQ